MFKAPFSFEGRIRRTEYGISFIIYFICAVILNLSVDSLANSAAGLFIFLFYFPLLWFFWAQGAKRCHDVGNNGWFQIIPFYILILIFKDGEPGENR